MVMVKGRRDGQQELQTIPKSVAKPLLPPAMKF
jgi:hypothetical protein